MSNNNYKKCGFDQYVKNGRVRSEQRYKCKVCGCNFPLLTFHDPSSKTARCGVLSKIKPNAFFCVFVNILKQWLPIINGNKRAGKAFVIHFVGRFVLSHVFLSVALADCT